MDRGHYADDDGWDKVVGDVLRVRQLLADVYPLCPVILLGHGMESYIAQSFVMRKGGNNVGLILSDSTLAIRIELCTSLLSPVPLQRWPTSAQEANS